MKRRRVQRGRAPALALRTPAERTVSILEDDNMRNRPLHPRLFACLFAVFAFGAARAETIRVAVGTQDTTINCAAGGLLILRTQSPRQVPAA